MNQRSLDRLKGVKQILVDILVEASKDTPYPFEIPPDGGLRTAERQNQLFKEGKSKCDGFKIKGEHQKGNAFDIFLLINGTASWDKDKLTKVARHIQEVADFEFGVKLNWGGSWKSFPDFPHFQLT
jgi:peptidoglycan L-alanyl-D-glutamate endopeptidase CwlK